MLSWNCDTTQEHKGWKKIIATTDPKFSNQQYTKEELRGYEPIKYGLPQIPQSFIEEYCKAGGIDEVLVEVESWDVPQTTAPFVDNGELKGIKIPTHKTTGLYPKPKLNPDNTIIIHPVEEKMYSREKVEDIVEFVVYQMMFKSNVFPSDQKERMKELIKIGIEENL
jgi:hypothetical protein